MYTYNRILIIFNIIRILVIKNYYIKIMNYTNYYMSIKPILYIGNIINKCKI